MPECPICHTLAGTGAKFCPRCGAKLSHTDELRAGTLLHNSYRIVKRIGGGGEGNVYLADHIHLLTWHAIKETLEDTHMDPTDQQEARKRFLETARLLAGLNHPNLPKVTDYFDDYATVQAIIDLPPHPTDKGQRVSPSSLGSQVDFVLVTALSEERDAVLEKLSGYYQQLPPNQEDIRTYYQVDLPVTFSDNSTGHYRIIVMCLLGMGRVQAATATADAIRRWRPRYIVLVGIAGGIAGRNVHIGDILIADQIVDYELQKLTPRGPEMRWDVQRADARLLDACNNFRNLNWQDMIQIKRPDNERPTRHTGPIASGDKVIAFSDVLARYRNEWPKLIGVEMEAAGIAAAAFQAHDRPGFFMVRGVSDLADENKGSDDVEKWRAYASDVAASFTIAFLKSGPVPLYFPTQIKSTPIDFDDKVAGIPRSKAKQIQTNIRLYLVMEYIEGQTLQEILDKAPDFLDEKLIVDWGIQVCNVLDYLHNQQPAVIFRDIKPGNLMLNPYGVIKLIDFGIARRFDPGKAGDTVNLGTPGYSPPEQYGKDAQTEPRSDIYALGATLYHLSTRQDPGEKPPFFFPSLPARGLNPRLSRGFADILHKATQTRLEDRFSSAKEMRLALVACQRGHGPLTGELEPPRALQIISQVVANGGQQNLLTWEPSPTSGVSYWIVRKPGNAPSSYTDGAHCATVDSIRYTDPDPPPGAIPYYAVYAFYDGQFSAKSVHGAADMRLADVTQLKAMRLSPTRVRLTWHNPENVEKVIVRRSPESAPIGWMQGESVALSSQVCEVALDTVPSAHLYLHYTVFCQFRDAARGVWLTSSGSSVIVGPA